MDFFIIDSRVISRLIETKKSGTVNPCRFSLTI
jgi:hypothetical protein